MSATDAKTDESAHNSPQPTQATDTEVREAFEDVTDDHGRREFLKRVGVGTVAIATAGGTGAVASSESVEAIAPAAAAFYLTTGAAAGVATGSAVDLWGQPDTDVDDVVELQIYEAAASVAEGRDEFVNQMENDFIGGDSNSFERSAWSEIRAAAVREIVDGGSESDAYDAALDALRRQATRAIVNIFERWNTGLDAMVEQMVLQHEEDVNVFYYNQSAIDDRYPNPATEEELDMEDDHLVEPVGAGETSGDDGTLLWRMYPWTPMDASELEGRDEDAFLLAATDGDSGFMTAVPSDETYWDEVGDPNIVAHDEFQADHDDMDEITVLDGELFDDVLSTIYSSYDDIRADLQDYTDAIYDGVHQGDIDPADVLSSQDIVDQFADSDENARLASELLAIGAEVPDSTGYRATISHDDLEADELEGLLYPQFADEAVSITPGTVLEPDDYNIAYFGYESTVDDRFETVALTGEVPLEVIDVDNVDGQEAIDTAGDTAGDDGHVIVHEGDDPPEPIVDPTHEDYDGWKIVVYGETNRHVADLTDVEEDGDEYYLGTTDLESDEAIESVEIVPSVDYEQSVDYVADPTEVEGSETIERMEALRDQVDELEEALDDDDDGGVALPGMPDNPFEGGGALAGFAIIAVVITAVVGFVTDNIPGLGD